MPTGGLMQTLKEGNYQSSALYLSTVGSMESDRNRWKAIVLASMECSQRYPADGIERSLESMAVRAADMFARRLTISWRFMQTVLEV
jgi:hypothetical protein